MKHITRNNLTVPSNLNKPHSWFDLSVASLIVSNVLVVILVITGHYDLRYLAFVYWLETVIINVILPIKVILLRKYYELLRIAFIMGIVNILFFGGFFIGFFQDKELLLTFSIVVMIIVLWVNRVISFIYNWKRDKQFLETTEWPLRVTILRLFPLYGLCCFIFFSSARVQTALSIIFFMLVKTVLDIILHVIEHHHKSSKSKPLGMEPVLVCALFFFIDSVLLSLNPIFMDNSFWPLDLFDKIVLIILIIVEILLTIFMIGFTRLCFKMNSKTNLSIKK